MSAVPAPAFLPLPTNPVGRWEAVRRFAAGWLGVPAGHVGEPGVTEWTRWTSHLDAHGALRRALRDDVTIGAREDLGGGTAVLTLAEGNVVWVVPAKQALEPDPPVDAWVESGDDGFVFLRHWTPNLTGFALVHLASYLHTPMGGFALYELGSLDEADTLIAPLTRSRVDLGDFVLVEGDDLVAYYTTLWSADGEVSLKVELGGSWPDRVLPESLANLARRAGMVHGRFLAPH
jgi:hypothetical protein